MKYRCDHCDEYHDIDDLTINIGDEGHQLIDDINEVVIGVVEKRAEKITFPLLMYALAANLEETKQTGLELRHKSHTIEMIIQVARNDVIDDISEEEQEKKK
jgi:hypothetical protein